MKNDAATEPFSEIGENNFLGHFYRHVFYRLEPVIQDFIQTQKNDLEDLLFNQPIHYHDPLLLPDIISAGRVFWSHIEEGKRIAIFGDKDVDGLTAITSIVLFLRSLDKSFAEKSGTHANYLVLFDEREEADYGLSRQIVQEAYEAGCSLIISLDTGTSDFLAIEYARSLHIEVIVLDHHEPRNQLPDAWIINPKRESAYPFAHLATAGLVIKFMHAMMLISMPRPFLFVWEKNEIIQFQILHKGVRFQSQNLEEIFTTLVSLPELREWKSITIISDNKQNGNNTLTNIRQHQVNLNNQIPDNPFAALRFEFFEWTEWVQGTLQTYQNKQPKGSFCFWGNPLTGFLSNNVHELFWKPAFIFSQVDLPMAHLLLQMSTNLRIKERIESLLPLAALGTLADMMPLQGENRFIVRNGLALIRAGKKTLFQILADSLNLFIPQMRSRTISWSIAPLLNSPGRLGSGIHTLNFLLSEDRSEQHGKLEELLKINRERKSIVDRGKEKALSLWQNQNRPTDKLAYAVLDDLPIGLTGLVASRVADESNMPAVVIALSSQKAVGSARTFGQVDVLTMVEHLADKLLLYGGHREAAGFSMSLDNVESVLTGMQEYALRNYAEQTSDIVKTPTINLKLSELNAKFINELDWLEPYGMGNREPVLAIHNIPPLQFQTLGKKNEHGKFAFQLNSDNGSPATYNVEIIGWNLGKLMSEIHQKNQPFTAIGELDINLFRGMVRINLLAKEFKIE